MFPVASRRTLTNGLTFQHLHPNTFPSHFLSSINHLISSSRVQQFVRTPNNTIKAYPVTSPTVSFFCSTVRTPARCNCTRFLVMKILKENADLLTNFEVLDFLRSKGAVKDPTQVLAPVAPSEFKVYDYLVSTPACSQTRESIAEFVTKCKPYKLTKSEITNIVNIRPTSYVEIDPLTENLDSRLGESVEELVGQLFSPPADESKPDE